MRRTRNLAAFSRFLESASFSQDLKLFTWRTGAGAEVDFVAYGGDALFAIEVKRSRRMRRTDLQSLTQFKADYPMARCVLLFGGDRREHRDGIDLLPVAEALADPAIVLSEASTFQKHVLYKYALYKHDLTK